MRLEEVDRLAAVIHSTFPEVPELADPVWSWPSALKVVDCVLSLNRPYDRVVYPRVDRFGRQYPGVQSISQLREHIQAYDSVHAFVQVDLQYNDREGGDASRSS